MALPKIKFPTLLYLEDQLENNPEHTFQWMLQIKDMTSKPDDGCIHFLVDPKGGIGKTAFCEWMEYYDWAFDCWEVGSDIRSVRKELFRLAGTQSTFLFDCPWAMTQNRLRSLWTVLQEIKQGIIKQNRNKQRRIASPHVWVLTHIAPAFSDNRVRVWHVDDKGILQETSSSV